MNFWTIAKKEFLIRIKSKWFIFGTFVMPILILGMSLGANLLSATGAMSDTKSIVLFDETGLYGEKIINAIEDENQGNESRLMDIKLETSPLESVKDDYTTLVTSGGIEGYFLLPADFNETLEIRYYSSGKGAGINRHVREFRTTLNAILFDINIEKFQISHEVMKALENKTHVKSFDIASEGELSEAEKIAKFITPFMFLFLLFMGVFTGAQQLMRAIIEERASRVIEIILSTVSHMELLGGKILGMGMLGLTQSAIYLIVGFFVSNYFGISVISGPIVVLFLLYYVLGYLFYASIFSTMGALFESEQEAQQAVSVVTVIAIIPMMMWFMVLESPNSTLVNVLCYFPPVTPYFMILKVAIGETTVTQTILTLSVLLISTLAVLKIGSKIFETAILMYGKRVTLPEILRWIKS